MRRYARILALGAMIGPWGVGCYFGLDGGADSGDGDGDAGDGDTGGEPLCDAVDVGSQPIRRLTSEQFVNSLRALFGDQIDVGTDLLETESISGFRTYVDNNVMSATGAENVHATAELVAAQVVADPQSYIGCDPGAAGCIDTFLDGLVARAYRRPLLDEERTILLSVYDTTVSEGFTPAEGVGSLVELVINSPQFLYVYEWGERADAAPGELVALTDYEVAARLSYFLWNSPPDDDLWNAAAAGELSDPDQVEAQARRLLADDRALPVLGGFLEDLLELSRFEGAQRDPALFPQWDAALQDSMRAQLTQFIRYVLRDGDGTLAALLSTNASPVDAELAELYGVAAPADGAWSIVDAPADQRAGLLTLPGFLASHANAVTTSPVARGSFVRGQLLCTIITPPPDVEFDLPPYDPNESVRERLAKHRSDPACYGCHSLMDPVGFGLENFDSIGQWRTVEGNGIPVDASGELVGAGSDFDGPFNGPIELADKLATNPIVRECVATQMFRFMVARHDETEDACSIANTQAPFEESDGSLEELLVGLVRTDAFLLARIPED